MPKVAKQKLRRDKFRAELRQTTDGGIAAGIALWRRSMRAEDSGRRLWLADREWVIGKLVRHGRTFPVKAVLKLYLPLDEKTRSDWQTCDGLDRIINDDLAIL